MAKYFEVDFRKGSFADQTGQRTVTVTGSPQIKRGEKGNAGIIPVSGGSNNLVYSSQVLPDNAFTLVAYAKYRYPRLPILQMLVSDATFTYCGIGLCDNAMYISGSKPFIQFGSANGTNFHKYTYTPIGNDYHCFIFTMPGSAKADISSALMYADGVSIASGGAMPTGDSPIARTNIKYVGYLYDTYNDKIDSNILYLATYDHVFTEQERANAYKDFLNSYPTVQEKYPNVINKPLDLSREKNNTLTEICVNGGFDSSTGWTLSGLSSISGGVLTITGDGTTSNECYATSNPLIIGRRYKFTYQIVSNTAVGGTDTTRLYDTSAFTREDGSTFYDTSLGYHTFFGTALANYIDFRSRTVFTSGSIVIDNVSCQLISGLIAAYNLIPNGNTLVDISGNGLNGAIGNGVTSIKKGLSFSGKGSVIVGNIASLNNATKVTVCTRLRKLNTGDTIELGTYISGTNGLFIQWYSNNIIYFGARNGEASHGYITPTFTSEFIDLVMVYDGTQATANNRVTAYMNGVALSLSYANTLPTSLSATGGNDFRIGGITSGPTYSKGEFQDLRIYNRALSIQEVKNYHNQFVQPSLVEDFSTEGADGVSKVPSGWNRVSGAFKVNEWQPVRTDIINQSTWYTLAYWTNYQPAWTQVGSTLSCNGTGFIYKDSITTIGKRYRARIFANISSGTCVLSDLSTGYMDVSIVNGLNIIEFTSPYARIGLQGTSFVATISSFTITEIPPLPAFKPGTKYLECVTAGVIAIPSRQAYGTWEFDWYKGNTNNYLNIYPVNPVNKIYPNTNSYLFQFDIDERLLLMRVTGAGATTILSSAASYHSVNTWYRFKITRSLAGVFTLFIKGGAFVPTVGYDNWTLLSVTGGSGTNPVTDNTYTTSEYFVLDIDAGDRITNIQLTDGIKRNELYGPELIDQSAWYTLAYWTTAIGSGFTQAGNTLSGVIANSGYLSKNILTIGKRYKVVMTLSTISAGNVNTQDLVTVNFIVDQSSPGTYTGYNTAGAVSFGIQSKFSNAVVTALSVKEVTQE